ncbi:hypothetical protein [Arthrobacter rhombi]|uniref:Uncharacterized protein n=1 Tax=Arthrobacter rhombi TaxID=71253 RepID=A0A1R4FLH1_9MICC|nr:hypothetical protein [Arthrobacter rhombi]SJM56768.1 hypothetical protein FM101_04615 [Arthrobacter rhombi]
MAYKIDPGQLHAILVDVAADGESLRLVAQDTKTSGDEASGDFGTATTVSAAFARFWTPRDDIGQRAASLVFRKTTSVSDAALALIDADGKMSGEASSALDRVPVEYHAPPIWEAGRPVPQFSFSWSGR